MEKISNAGRTFYGISIAGIGFQAIYFRDFPYMLIPQKHEWIPGLTIIAIVFGIMFLLVGTCTVFEKNTRLVTILLGSVLLLIFCFYFIPYQFIATSNYMQLLAWENAEKELALACGAFIIAGSYSNKNENYPGKFSRTLIRLGVVIFSIIIISFGILHFKYAKGAAEYIPSWIPSRLFWTYVAGTALIGSGLAIILKIKPGLSAVLLGTMIFIWFIILHIPKAIAFPFADTGSEVTSAFLALAYSGTAFVIAGLTVAQNKNINLVTT